MRNTGSESAVSNYGRKQSIETAKAAAKQTDQAAVRALVKSRRSI